MSCFSALHKALLSSFVILCSLTAEKSYAYDDLSMEEIWNRFLKNCEQVVTVPDEYISSLSIPGEYGARVVSRSPDQNSVSIYNRIENSYDQIVLQKINDIEVRDCSVYGEYWDSKPEDLSQEFLNLISSKLGLSITGGHTPQEFYDEESKYDHDGYYIYSIFGAWEGRDWIARGHIVENELQLFLLQTVKLEK